MALIGERAGHRWAVSYGDEYVTASWDLDFPPSAAFIKIFQGGTFEFEEQSAVDIAILNIRRRLPNGADETITFPSPTSISHVLVKFDAMMTHVTLGMTVRGAVGDLVYTLGFWGSWRPTMAERTKAPRDDDAVVGSVPPVIGVDAIALFDPADGRVVHMHQITTFAGAERRTPDEQRQAGIEAARHLGHDVAGLDALHVPDFQPGISIYRVDLANRQLMAMPPPALTERIGRSPRE
jgi:hypothetical protein